jgi:cytochrome b subunit of formate dehydrogenase
MTLHQRIQHIFCFATFSTLVLTGFPIKFAGEPWSYPLIKLFGGAFMAGRIHRVAGVAMLIGTAYHLLYVLITTIAKARVMYQKYPPEGFSDFISKLVKLVYNLPTFPRIQDGVDIADFVKYSLFLTNERPQYTKWSWKEKFEYLAFLAGGMVIGMTGLMLMYPTITVWLGMPARTLNIAFSIHTNEALLAASVIFIWHFYNAVLCPEKFPMDGCILDGCIPEHDLVDEHIAEYKRIMLEGENAPGLVKETHH